MMAKAGNFEWTKIHETLLIREILVEEPFKLPKGSISRGACWGKISENLNDLKDPEFRVTKRSVREKFNSLMDKFKEKNRKEQSASGIAVPPQTEFEKGLETIIEYERENALIENEKTEKGKADQRKAQDMRLKALERVGQTKKRTNKDEDEVQSRAKKVRRNGSETVEFLKQKMEFDRELRQEEMAVKMQEQEQWKEMMLNQQQQQQQMMQNQQQQQQQMLQMMQQQQQMFMLMLNNNSDSANKLR